jgi:cytochrome bd-type quinol oxidase subunit 2
MEPEEYYSYPEEEQATRRRTPTPGLFVGLLVGLLIGGLGGYYLGSQSKDGLRLFDASSSPNITVILNIITLIAVLILAVFKRSQRFVRTENPVGGRNGMNAPLLFIILALLIAGVVGFIFIQGLPK